jgi:hypothetical protein
MRLVSIAAGLILVLGGCGRVFVRARPLEEKRSEIPGAKFKVLATISGDESRAARGVTANLRADLAKAGITAVPSAGRWETEKEAARAICARTDQPIDGVLLVTYGDLILTDCQTLTTAYSVDGDASDGGPGIRAMTQRLIDYLKGNPAPQTEAQK